MQVYKSSLKYPARTALSPYYIVICDLPDCKYISTISPQKGNIFENKVIKYITSVLVFSTTFV